MKKYLPMLVIIVVLLLALPGSTLAQTTSLSSTFTYQGYLTNASGVVNGTCDFQFSLFNAASAGTQIGSTLTQAGVTVTNGTFNVPLDFGATAFDGTDRYLDIAVRCPAGSGVYTTLTPRQAITPAPYTLFAEKAPWNGLSGIPAGFADGTDNDVLAGLACSSGQIPSWNGTSWTCATDSTGTDWTQTGNSGTTPGTNFIGTTDNQPLEFRVNNLRVLLLQPNATSPNIIGGFNGNNALTGVVGATIGGGGELGLLNVITDEFGVIGGGENNVAGNNAGSTSDAIFATVGGGRSNSASGDYTTVGGGNGNTIIGPYGTVGGGNTNSANGQYSVVGGGTGNVAGGQAATIAGGSNNNASGSQATIGGGNSNTASNQYALVGGGNSNTAGGPYATVGGGLSNSASNFWTTVGGGSSDLASAQDATIGGGSANQAGGVDATVAGGNSNNASGQSSMVGGGKNNTASGQNSTVGGGQFNTAGDQNATVSGGSGNNAIAPYTTVAGGTGNLSAAQYATVAGGFNNSAQGISSFAAGNRAQAIQDGTFVWADSTPFDISSNGINTFTARTTGGVRFISGIDTSGFPISGVSLAPGDGSWSSLSDRNVKSNFVAIDPQAILQSVVNLPISSWNYNAQDPAIRHIGPMAQDFYASFGVGEDDTHITTIDSEGVALAAIQGLYQQVQAKDAEISDLPTKNADLQAKLDDLDARVTALENGKSAPESSGGVQPWMLVGGLVVGGVWFGQRKNRGEKQI